MEIEAYQTDRVLEERKEKLKQYFKKANWIYYAILAVIVWISVKIRTRNLDGLRDITTGNWTLGPDLDPFLFLRWAKYIVENGALFAVDTMRYVPLGFDIGGEFLLHPYLMAWFHYLASLFGSESVTQSAVIYPVFMFALTVIAFFLLARKIFIDRMGAKKANIIALISAFFLSVLPSLLPRTIAGIPEKESAAFLFLFLAFFLFLSAWKAKTPRSSIIYAVLAGLATLAMASIWGGFILIFYTIGLATFISFILGEIRKRELYVYSAWLFTALILMALTAKHTALGVLTSVSTGSSIAVLFIILVHSAVFNTDLRHKLYKSKLARLPPHIFSVILAVIIGAIASSIFFGPSFIVDKFSQILNVLIKPATSRLIQTVAENRQPFFTEWAGSFGPSIKGVPLFFWLFFIGSIYLFNDMVKLLRGKDRIFIVASYTIFLTAIIFSRYSGNSTFNGTNTISLGFYFLGFVALAGSAGYYYFKYYKSGELDRLRNIDYGFILLFIFFFLTIIATRGAVRGILFLVPPTSIIVSYFTVSVFYRAKNSRDGTHKTIALIVAGIVIVSTIFAGYHFYQVSNATAKGYVPSVYSQQWQKAMFWVRSSTDHNAVFTHWWDYGYWIQSIGERSTVLDGGNAISYWNHLMGRYALTGTSNEEALELLYTHNVTHFLIDSTDIGKYSAFSFIGSDENLDRRSYIPTLLRDDRQMQETKNSTIYVYPSNIGLDEDIIYDNNGTRIFLPGGKAGVSAILVSIDPSGNIVEQPEGIFVYQGNQYRLPLRYAYNKEFIDFGSGIESGIFLFPRLTQGASSQIIENGAMFYLSKRTVKSQLARLYLYNEDNDFFKLAHVEDDFIVSQIKAQNGEVGDFIYFQGFRGPIKIWEVSYPDDIEFKEEFLETTYPEELSKA